MAMVSARAPRETPTPSQPRPPGASCASCAVGPIAALARHASWRVLRWPAVRGSRFHFTFGTEQKLSVPSASPQERACRRSSRRRWLHFAPDKVKPEDTVRTHAHRLVARRTSMEPRDRGTGWTHTRSWKLSGQSGRIRGGSCHLPKAPSASTTGSPSISIRSRPAGFRQRI